MKMFSPVYCTVRVALNGMMFVYPVDGLSCRLICFIILKLKIQRKFEKSITWRRGPVHGLNVAHCKDTTY